MNRLASAGTVNRLNPSAAKPTTIILRVRIFISRAKAASSDTGAASGSSYTSSSTSRFSHWPRAGSGILNASSAMTATGTPSMKNGVRQPYSWPIHPAAIGLIAARVLPTIELVAAIRPRTDIG